ncbi:Gfo/Idh/MocA family protein [Cryptosporangium phraense]|uniref:Gfo/Idh/MocA family oxidoreductase n=1 Tax=Cryptosporangium phraense TaxID=2593070 RepID=A0A545APF2_9ACTN|nr:Gfo/Idh/MocA family oxidoreductase [Cryptosporangium phraense]TQS43170.1 Gfo/Idh/MocA family oxidoreductase [Cryptosporangium phraense]
MTLRWGILGTGGIARTFTSDLRTLDDHEVVAVGSRAAETATAYADEFGIPHAHASYQALADDPDVDVIYVATPHSGHASAALTFIGAGKHVLVEKPFTMDEVEAAEVVAAARAAGVFCMEAMWTRFNPAIARIRDLLADGAIGEVVTVEADFGFPAEYDPAGRLFAPELGGGALLDLGVYPISFASMILGEPATVLATTGLAPTGVDANTGVLLGYESGAVAVLHCSLRGLNPIRAAISGTTGRIDIPPTFFRPEKFTLVRTGAEPVTEEFTLPGLGYTFQAEEVARRIRAGETESPLMTLDETLSIMRTLDRARTAAEFNAHPAGSW